MVWRQSDPPLYQDRQSQTDYTSGMGHINAFNLMALPEITEGAADYALVREPPMGIGGTQPVTIYLPTVGVAYANGGGDRMASASLDMFQVDDPEQLGVDGLLRPNHVRDD